MTKRGFVDDISAECLEDISDEILNSVFDASEEEEEEQQQYGRSLFEFEFQKIGYPTRWKNTVDKERFQATLHHKRNPTKRDNLVQEI